MEKHESESFFQNHQSPFRGEKNKCEEKTEK